MEFERKFTNRIGTAVRAKNMCCQLFPMPGEVIPMGREPRANLSYIKKDMDKLTCLHQLKTIRRRVNQKGGVIWEWGDLFYNHEKKEFEVDGWRQLDHFINKYLMEITFYPDDTLIGCLRSMKRSWIHVDELFLNYF